ncbi:unnamed protein product, partial [Staurois parvus]
VRQVQVSWAPVGPHCCCLHRPPACPTFRSSSHCVFGQFVFLVWQFTGPHAAAGPPNRQGPPYPLLAAPRSRVSHGSCTASPLLLSPSTTLCHVPLSGILTLLVCSIFC